jgi:hypothetical protein
MIYELLNKNNYTEPSNKILAFLYNIYYYIAQGNARV